ncbi:MAG TPA: NAD(P)-dependent oxidoreductase [Cryomorphaceae bacterium]|nr:NAD(P)-dependent oxidoreductase [Cryomorphaceae bacterium]
MKVTIYSVKDFERPFLQDYGKDHDLHLIPEPLCNENADQSEGSKAVITFPTDTVSDQVIDQLKSQGIDYLISRSAGVDHIEIDHAHEQGMKVANTPEYSNSAIAEHAIAMMLLLNRNLIKANKKIDRHDFRLKGLVGKELSKQTVGIVGVGSIGSKVTEILNGFGSEILLYDVVKNEELEKKYNARYVELEELCRNSDIITIHAPLNDKTKHLIDREKIERMKNGVVLLNLSRGGIVKTEDLIEALKSGKVGKAGLDVYENEKGLFFFDHSDEPINDEMFTYLESNENVFITAHQAFTTETALTRMTKMAFETLEKWEDGEEPENTL